METSSQGVILRRQDGHRGIARSLTHPAFTGAVAMLAVNDYVLKPAFSSWWTGKLSDFAGLFVIAVVLGVLGRPRLAAVATGAGFAAIKLSATAAALVAPVLGGVTRQDPSDLMALVVLFPACAFAQRTSFSCEGPFLPTLLSFTSIAVVALSTSATSCYNPPVVDAFAVQGSVVFARMTGPRNVVGAPPTEWAVSSDGGRHWAKSLPPTAPAVVEKTACTNHDCVQVIPGSRVEEREGAAPWTVAYAFTDEQRERIRLHIPPFTCGVSAADEFGAVSTVVAGGEHVVVAMGTQGVLHRGPDGRWERRAVLGREPLSTMGPSWLARLQLAPLVLVVAAPLLWLLARRRGAKTRGLVVLGLSGAGGLALSSGTGLVGLVGLDYTILGPAAAFAAIGVFVASLAIAMRARVDRRA